MKTLGKKPANWISKQNKKADRDWFAFVFAGLRLNEFLHQTVNRFQ
jgi:hypothetical protein